MVPAHCVIVEQSKKECHYWRCCLAKSPLSGGWQDLHTADLQIAACNSQQAGRVCTLRATCLQPKQVCPRSPHRTARPRSPAQSGKASSQGKEICACKTPHLVWSHKHKAPGCVAFWAGVALEKMQRSGINFPEDAADITWFHNESLKLEKGNSPGKSKGVIKRT